MPTFYNQATLSLGGVITNSNTTEAEFLSGLTISKTAINSTYSEGGAIVYAITVTNAGASAYDDLSVRDNLGAFASAGGAAVVPLSYVDGSIIYYLNGALQTPPTVTDEGELVISGINLPAGGSATFIYEARVNEFAPLEQGASITNTAMVNGCGGEASASATVTVEEAQRLSIAKAVSPDTVTCNGRLTYTIILQNLGNMPVVATDGAIISDVFNPVLSNITVTLNGAELAVGVGYTYDEATGEFATTDGTLTVPAATFLTNESGAVVTTPGVTVLTVSGTV